MSKKNIRTVPDDVLCNDNPTKYAHLGMRVLCALLSWFFLGLGINEGGAFFSAVTIYIMPLLLDYYKYEPQAAIRCTITYLAKSINWIFLISSMLGLFGVFSIVNYNGVQFITTSTDFIIPNYIVLKLVYFWWLCGLTVMMCVIDWVVDKTTIELSIVDKKEGYNHV